MNIDKEISEIANRIAEQTKEILEENKILRKALMLACKDLNFLEGRLGTQMKIDFYIEEAKESLDEN